MGYLPNRRYYYNNNHRFFFFYRTRLRTPNSCFPQNIIKYIITFIVLQTQRDRTHNNVSRVMIDTAHFLFSESPKKKKNVLNQTTPKDAPVWYCNVLFTPNRHRYVWGHDDFSIIYVCVQTYVRTTTMFRQRLCIGRRRRRRKTSRP